MQPTDVCMCVSYMCGVVGDDHAAYRCVCVCVCMCVSYVCGVAGDDHAAYRCVYVCVCVYHMCVVW